MKKILLIRFSSIGDIVLTTPVIRALKKQIACEVHTLTKKHNALLYKDNPYVDKVFYFEHSPTEILQQLKEEHYDFVVDLQKNLRSLKIKRLLKVPSATFPKVNIQKWLLVNFKVNFLPKLHIVDRYFEAVKTLDIKNDKAGLDFFIPKNDEVDVATISPILTEGYIGIVIGGQHFTKIMPVEKVGEIINRLSMPVVLLGGQEDVGRGEEIISLIPEKQVFNTCGKYNINQSASLVKQCRVLITNDTGLMHIGASFRKPIISVWGNTVSDFGMYPYMPEDENKYFISEVTNLSCRPCSKLGHNKCPKKHFRCMMDQDTVRIVQEVNRFIA